MIAKADPLAAFDSLLGDRAFWEEFEVSVAAGMVPVMFQIFVAGYLAGSELTATRFKAYPETQPAPLDPESIGALADAAIREYVSPFARSFTETTYDGVRDAVLRARRDGTGIEGVLSAVEGLFGPARASAVGVTETTRLFGLGAQASYRAQGINGWQWMTVNDPWVDNICAGLAADSDAKPFPIDKLFEPAHPRCRCFPAPVLIDEPKKPPVPLGDPYAFPKNGFTNTEDLEKWARQRFGIDVGLLGGDLRALNPTLRQLDMLRGKYPDVFAKHLRSLSVVDFGDANANVWAWVVDGRDISLNLRWYGVDRYDQFVASVKDAAKRTVKYTTDAGKRRARPLTIPGFHPLGSEDISHVIVHEFGHVVDSYLAARARLAYLPYTRYDGGGEAYHMHSLFHSIFSDRNANKALKDLSGYAVQGDYREAFAEAFAQMHSAIPMSQWNSTTKALKKYLDAVMDAPLYDYSKGEYGFVSDIASQGARDAANRALEELYEAAGLPYSTTVGRFP